MAASALRARVADRTGLVYLVQSGTGSPTWTGRSHGEAEFARKPSPVTNLWRVSPFFSDLERRFGYGEAPRKDSLTK